MERGARGVKGTAVTPYYTDTGRFAGVRWPVIPSVMPGHGANQIVAAVRSDRILLRLPWLLNLVPLVRALLPARWFDKIGGEWLGVYHSMDDFKGRP